MTIFCNLINKGGAVIAAPPLLIESAYKPGSVYAAIYLGRMLPHASSHLPKTGRASPAHQSAVFLAVLLRIEFTGPRSHLWGRWALTPPFHPYRAETRRYISVALVLKSPSADVIRYPALRSPDFPHTRPFGAAHAAAQLTRFIIIHTIPTGCQPIAAVFALTKAQYPLQ